MEIKYDINLDVSKDDFVNNRIAEIANYAGSVRNYAHICLSD